MSKQAENIRMTKSLFKRKNNNDLPLITGSRPSSLLGCSPAQHSTPTQQNSSRSTILTPSGLTIVCDVCQKSSFYIDEQQVSKQPVNMALKRLIQRYKRAKTPLADTPCSSSEDWPPDCKVSWSISGF